MGDRTSVCLQILVANKEIAEPIMGECDHQYESDLHSYYSFYEVNYGELGCLTALQEAGVPFDSSWDHGSEYGPGTDYCRFTANGELRRFSVSDSDINPDIKKCMELIHKPDELIKYITEHHDYNTPLPWDNQEEYSKIFRTRKLIST